MLFQFTRQHIRFPVISPLLTSLGELESLTMRKYKKSLKQVNT